jgi:hypothetical protein
MRIYKLINPNQEVLIIVAGDFYEAIQKAKKIDNYKFNESQYKRKYTISNLDNEIYKNYSVKP